MKKMLDYFKSILTRVSFDARLFEKELLKAIKSLIVDEIQELKAWCYANFGNEHEAILNRCFVIGR
jgi:O-phosphoseryl-tRNA(Cys) synthetase